MSIGLTMRLLSWARSDTGKKRDHNEDSFLADDELGLYAVCDGMGGHQGGGHASQLACKVLAREISAAQGDYTAAADELRKSGTAVGKKRRLDGDSPTVEYGTEDTIDGSEDTLDGTEPLPNAPPPIVIARGDDETTQSAEAPTADALPVFADPELVMASAAMRAGREIFDAAQASDKLRGMGTTLSAIVYDDGHMYFVHAGDSRVYLFRDGKLRQLTEDHSWIWEQIKSGAMTEEEAKTSKFRHIITRSVGFEREIDVDTGVIAVQAGDLFLLCSDGMSNYVETDELERILAANWFRRVPQLLVDIANDRGGDDNITVVVAYAANDRS